MAAMTVEELRTAFLRFFEAREHRRIPSSSLVPHGDPSLLFTAAGMVQFKPYFLGIEDAPATRMTSVQKCFRTTDVESVGDDSHLTFFEMLGNFSIGDYFKAEAVEWAWDFLTGELGLAPERLWATVFTTDNEAYELWKLRGLPEERILRYTSAQGNYWYSGDTGPCGPCSELHYDFGRLDGCEHCRDGDCHPDIECGRFLEIWNLVFMAFDCAHGEEQHALPAQNIDTGAGLERVAWVLQDVRSVYETDQLRSILARAEELSAVAYDPAGAPEAARALRSITEHSRALAFLIHDGVLPANEGRGYVLRRVLRRAVYFGHTLGLNEPFLQEMVGRAIEASPAYPELTEQREFIMRVVGVEEARFQATLARGLELLEQVIERESTSRSVPGRDMFTLYDTHGLPPELTIEVAEERGYSVDRAGFEAEMEAQRVRSKGETAFGDFGDPRAERYAALGLASDFVGYEATEGRSAVTAVVRGETTVERLEDGDEGEVVLAASTFYPEGGGQVGDRGEIVTSAGRFRVDDTQELGEAIVHTGVVVEGYIEVGATAESRVDAAWRAGSARNHTATHLLHAALRAVVGDHVRQAGSLVAPDHLRFDYTHPEAPTAEQLREVQRLVNAKVREDIESATFELPYEEAIERGAIAFFEDRYTSSVRMVEYCEARAHSYIADSHAHTPACFSRELCGGTHLQTTGAVGSCQIVGDSSIGAGLRRLEALTGPEAERWIEERLDVVSGLAQRFRVPPLDVGARVEALEHQLSEERKRSQQGAQRASVDAADALVERAEDLDGVRLLIARVDASSADALRTMGDRLRDRLGTAFVLLGAGIEERLQFVAMATDDVVERGLRADDIVRTAAKVAGGGGGGRPQVAQAGGRDLSQLDAALEAAREAAHARLAGA